MPDRPIPCMYRQCAGRGRLLAECQSVGVPPNMHNHLPIGFLRDGALQDTNERSRRRTMQAPLRGNQRVNRNPTKNVRPTTS